MSDADHAKELAHVMLMCDLLSHRLASLYLADESQPAGEELAYALEKESRQMLEQLDAAQSALLDHQAS